MRLSILPASSGGTGGGSCVLGTEGGDGECGGLNQRVVPQWEVLAADRGGGGQG
jgi:hypothetical protein